MRLLLDTNILTAIVNRRHPQRALIIGKVQEERHELYINPQVIYEFWVVATRPEKVNGLNLSPADVASEVGRFQLLFEWLPDPSDLFSRWLDLVSTHAVSGRPSHDARLAAAVLAHDLDALLTLNAPDFKRFGLTVLTPADL